MKKEKEVRLKKVRLSDESVLRTDTLKKLKNAGVKRLFHGETITDTGMSIYRNGVLQVAYRFF